MAQADESLKYERHLVHLLGRLSGLVDPRRGALGRIGDSRNVCGDLFAAGGCIADVTSDLHRG